MCSPIWRRMRDSWAAGARARPALGLGPVRRLDVQRRLPPRRARRTRGRPACGRARRVRCPGPREIDAVLGGDRARRPASSGAGAPFGLVHRRRVSAAWRRRPAPRASAAIRASTVPTSTSRRRSTRISASRPVAGAGTSVSILSVEIAQIVSSASTQSPTLLAPLDDRALGDRDAHLRHRHVDDVSVGEELTARLLDAVDARQHRLLERRRERDRHVGRGDPHDRPVEVLEARSAISAATWAPAAHVAFASSTIDHLRAPRTESRIASSSSGTSERRSSTSTDAPSRSSVASSAVCTIAP